MLATSGQELADDFVCSEFARRRGCKDPLMAMRDACEHLVAEYERRFSTGTGIYGVGNYCKLLNVDLVGRRRSPDTASLQSTAGYRHRHGGGTAHIRLSGRRPKIVISADMSRDQARVAVAHELGHLLIHRHDSSIHPETSRVPSTPAEEALSEYAGRMLLMPGTLSHDQQSQRPIELEHSADRLQLDMFPSKSSVLACLQEAGQRNVTLFASAARHGDADRHPDLHGAILWTMDSRVDPALPVYSRLTPAWHHCGTAFVPIRRCTARKNSAVDKAAAVTGQHNAIVEKIESVSIGSFSGKYRVEAFAWGSVPRGTRRVLSFFLSPGKKVQ